MVIRHVDEDYQKTLTIGQIISDQLTIFAGSWAFVISFLIGMAGWIVINVIGWIRHWDPYPFILLNLVLSCMAAIQAPIILMSQNRQTDRDRFKADSDYEVNVKAEKEIEDIQQDLEEIKHLVQDLTRGVSKDKNRG